ncbi:unnamed protein product, partial [Phaeothamnion confervicola]
MIREWEENGGWTWKGPTPQAPAGRPRQPTFHSDCHGGSAGRPPPRKRRRLPGPLGALSDALLPLESQNSSGGARARAGASARNPVASAAAGGALDGEEASAVVADDALFSRAPWLALCDALDLPLPDTEPNDGYEEETGDSSSPVQRDASPSQRPPLTPVSPPAGTGGAAGAAGAVIAPTSDPAAARARRRQRRERFERGHNCTLAAVAAGHHGLRAPHVCAVIESVGKPLGAEAVAWLADPTGRMEACLHDAALKDFGPDLGPGAAIVLRSAALWVSGPGCRRALNVHPRAVAAVFSVRTPSPPHRRLRRLRSDVA